MKKSSAIVVVLISTILVLTTPIVIGEKIETLNELDDVNFGFPFPFISQNLNLTPGAADLPIHVTLGNPMNGNYINSFSWSFFVLNIVTIASFLLLIESLRKRLVRNSES